LISIFICIRFALLVFSSHMARSFGMGFFRVMARSYFMGFLTELARSTLMVFLGGLTRLRLMGFFWALTRSLVLVFFLKMAIKSRTPQEMTRTRTRIPERRLIIVAYRLSRSSYIKITTFFKTCQAQSVDNFLRRYRKKK